jgi:hypothetical protein
MNLGDAGSTFEVSTVNPGPIVEQREAPLMKAPLWPSGLQLASATMKERTFSARASSVKLT